MTRLDHLLAGRTRGVCTVDPAASRVELTMRVCGLLGLRGRFTDVHGHVEWDDDPARCRVHVDVDTASLTAGSARRDAVLAAAGIIDPEAGPVITFRSHSIRSDPGGWRIDGVLGTDRCALPLRLAVGEPETLPGALRLRARGRVSRDDVVALVARPSAGVLLGPHAQLDLTLVVGGIS